MGLLTTLITNLKSVFEFDPDLGFGGKIQISNFDFSISWTNLIKLIKFPKITFIQQNTTTYNSKQHFIAIASEATDQRDFRDNCQAKQAGPGLSKWGLFKSPMGSNGLPLGTLFKMTKNVIFRFPRRGGR